METAINYPVLNDYWNNIKNWSIEMKKALLSRLNASVKTNEANEKAESWKVVFGIMKDDNFPTAAEIDEFMKDEDKDIPQFRNPIKSLSPLQPQSSEMCFFLSRQTFCHVRADMCA